MCCLPATTRISCAFYLCSEAVPFLHSSSPLSTNSQPTREKEKIRQPLVRDRSGAPLRTTMLLESWVLARPQGIQPRSLYHTALFLYPVAQPASLGLGHRRRADRRVQGIIKKPAGAWPREASFGLINSSPWRLRAGLVLGRRRIDTAALSSNGHSLPVFFRPQSSPFFPGRRDLPTNQLVWLCPICAVCAQESERRGDPAPILRRLRTPTHVRTHTRPQRCASSPPPAARRCSRPSWPPPRSRRSTSRTPSAALTS